MTEAPRIPQPCFGFRNRVAHVLVLQRCAFAELHVLEHLWQGREQIADFAHRLSLALNFRQHLQCRKEAIACCGEIGKYDVARLFATNVVAMRAHMFHHVAVTHLGAGECQLLTSEIALRPRFDMMVATSPPPRSSPRLAHDVSDERHELVAIHHLALVIGNDDTVRIAVERDADIRTEFPDFGAHGLGWVEPQSSLMLVPFGSLPIWITSAPSSHSAVGATL